MNKYYVLPYSMKSMGARLFAKTIGATILMNRGELPAPCSDDDDRVINWGCASPRRGISRPVNNYNAVRIASNKLHTYRALNEAEVPTVGWTEDMAIASDWLENGQTVYARALVNSHGGKGTTVIYPGDFLFSTAFYTCAFPTRREFRLHVINGAVYVLQEKKKKREHQDHNMHIRNLESGWVFCMNNLDPVPPQLCDVAIKAVDALNLDFGALDIALDKNDNVCVFEINTAPGLTKRTAEIYAQAFKDNFPFN